MSDVRRHDDGELKSAAGYGALWTDYRRRRWCCIAMCVVVPFALMLLMRVPRFQSFSEPATFACVGAAGSSWFVSYLWMMLWRCPKCRNRFFRTPHRNLPFTRKCLHCGLPKWAREDPGDTSATVVYSVFWADYRRRRRCFIFTCIVAPVALALLVPLQRFLDFSEPTMFAYAWMALFPCAASGSWMMFWNCPKCRNPFFYKRFLTNPLARKCRHCGLPKWAPRDPGAQGS